MKYWQPVSLPVWQKYLNVEVIFNSEFVISEVNNNSTKNYLK